MYKNIFKSFAGLLIYILGSITVNSQVMYYHDFGTTPVSMHLSEATEVKSAYFMKLSARGNDDNLNNLCTAPTITSINPLNGPVNTEVTITGSGFTVGGGTTGVDFDGVAAIDFTVISGTEIKAIVPSGANSGKITVTTDNCSNDSTDEFQVLKDDCEPEGEVFISELYDHHSGSYGMIELYNPSNTTIIFNGEYVLERAGNIGGSPAYSLILPGSIGPGDTYLVQSGTGIGCTLTKDTDMGQGINANDEFKLFKNGTLIDIAQAPQNIGYTVIRNPGAIAPNDLYNNNDWNFNPNDCSDLGQHTITPTGSNTNFITQHPDNAELCENNQAVFNVSVEDPAGMVYQWKMLDNSGNWIDVVDNTTYSGATTAILTIDNLPLSFDQNQYYCEVTSTSCALISDAAKLNVNPSPQVADISLTQPVCNDPTSMGTITVDSPLGSDFTYSIDGANFQSDKVFDNLAPGTYYISVKHTNGCTSITEGIEIEVVSFGPSAPDVSVTQPNCTTSTGTLTVDSPLGADLTYSIDGTTFQSGTVFSNVVPGNYTVTVQNSGNCTAETSGIVIEDAPVYPDIAAVSLVQPTCINPYGTIQVDSPQGIGLSYSIDGTNYQTDPVFNGLSPDTSYVVSVRNNEGCTSHTSAININAITTVPDVDIAIVQPDCDILGGIITVNSPLGSGYSYSINGSDFQIDPVFSELPAGVYEVWVQNQDGCTASIPDVVIDGGPDPAPDPGNISGPANVCPENEVSYKNQAPGGEWSVNDENIATIDSNGVLYPLKSGEIEVVYTVGTLCQASVSKTVTVRALPQPVVMDYFLCVDQDTGEPLESIVLNSNLSEDMYAFNWSRNGEVLPVATGAIEVNEAGEYVLEATNTATGCSAAVLTAIVVTSSAITGVVEVDNDFRASPIIEVKVTGGTGVYEYQLNNGTPQESAVFSNVNKGNHTVTVRDINGCGKVELKVEIWGYPHFFTPNGDGYNDYWNIEALQDQEFNRISIFDRYGKLLTQQKSNQQGWDGTYNGRNMPADDYWFVVEYTDEGEMKKFRSHFALKR